MQNRDRRSGRFRQNGLIEAVTPHLLEMGYKVLVITNDVVTTEDAEHVRRMLRGVLVEERIIGVETGACPHTAVREDPSMNIAAVEEMEARFPDGDVVLIESGGDNLTLTFSPALVDFFVYVIDVAAGDKIPRKDGPGISQSDILVINKTDLAPYVHADLECYAPRFERMRSGKPFIFTNCMTGEGIGEFVTLLRDMALFDRDTRVEAEKPRPDDEHRVRRGDGSLPGAALVLPVGTPGKTGRVRLGFELDGSGRSIMRDWERQAPLIVQQELYFDERMPDMPCVYILPRADPMSMATATSSVSPCAGAPAPTCIDRCGDQNRRDAAQPVRRSCSSSTWRRTPTWSTCPNPRFRAVTHATCATRRSASPLRRRFSMPRSHMSGRKVLR